MVAGPHCKVNYMCYKNPALSARNLDIRLGGSDDFDSLVELGATRSITSRPVVVVFVVGVGNWFDLRACAKREPPRLRALGAIVEARSLTVSDIGAARTISAFGLGGATWNAGSNPNPDSMIMG